MSRHRSDAVCLRCHSSTTPDTWSIVVIVVNIVGSALSVILGLAITYYTSEHLAPEIVAGLTATVMFLGGIRLAYRAVKRLFSTRVLFCSACGSQDLVSEEYPRARAILDDTRSGRDVVDKPNLERLRIATAEMPPSPPSPVRPISSTSTTAPAKHTPKSPSPVQEAMEKTARPLTAAEEREMVDRIAREDIERFKGK